VPAEVRRHPQGECEVAAETAVDPPGVDITSMGWDEPRTIASSRPAPDGSPQPHSVVRAASPLHPTSNMRPRCSINTPIPFSRMLKRGSRRRVWSLISRFRNCLERAGSR
jgi:hypothetical protein